MKGASTGCGRSIKQRALFAVLEYTMAVSCQQPALGMPSTNKSRPNVLPSMQQAETPAIRMPTNNAKSVASLQLPISGIKTASGSLPSGIRSTCHLDIGTCRLCTKTENCQGARPGLLRLQRLRDTLPKYKKYPNAGAQVVHQPSTGPLLEAMLTAESTRHTRSCNLHL